MDSQTIECAFRICNLIESKHTLSRNLDQNTRQLVSHITNTSKAPTNAQDKEYTKGSFQEDLKLLADGIFAATVQQPFQEQERPPTYADMQTMITQALSQTSQGPSHQEVQDIVTRSITHALPQVRSSVRAAIDQVLPRPPLPETRQIGAPQARQQIQFPILQQSLYQAPPKSWSQGTEDTARFNNSEIGRQYYVEQAQRDPEGTRMVAAGRAVRKWKRDQESFALEHPEENKEWIAWNDAYLQQFPNPELLDNTQAARKEVIQQRYAHKEKFMIAERQRFESFLQSIYFQQPPRRSQQGRILSSESSYGDY